MSDKPIKEQLNEILKQIAGVRRITREALPLRKPPVSMTQQSQSDTSNSNNASDNSSGKNNSSNSNSDRKK